MNKLFIIRITILFEQQEQLVVQVVSNTELINLTNEAHDLYCSQIAIPLWHVAVPSGLLRELSNR